MEKTRKHKRFVSFNQATTVRDAKRHIKWLFPWAENVKGQKADPTNIARGFIVEWN